MFGRLLRVCVRLRVAVYISMYVCTHVCIYIYLCMYICVCMYTRRHLGSSHLRSAKLCSQVRAAGPVFARAGEASALMFQMGDVETNEEDYDFQMRLATALSLSASEEPSLVHSQHQPAMPSGLVVKNISPNGWCFYDCVREHLHLASDEPETSISTSSIAALCLSCLALRREEFSDFLEDSEDTRVQRQENVFKHRQF